MNPEAKKRYKDMDMPFTCPISNKVFNTIKGLSTYITKSLTISKSDYYDKYINHRDSVCVFCNSKGKFISVGKGYRNLCENEECVKKSFNSHSVDGFMYRSMCSREEAEKLFDIENKRQLFERTKTQNELRKNDPDWDKKKSRNCKEFWILKGFTEQESIIKASEVMKEIHMKTSIKKKSNPEFYKDTYTTNIEYYLKQGFSEAESQELVSKRQTTFSLEICIDKHGEEEGNKIWSDRQEKWINTLDSKSDEEKIEINRKKLSGSFCSPISQRLFWDIHNTIGGEKAKFKELNLEFHLLDSDRNWLAYDYVDTKIKKCIEFNGDFWHCNPVIFKDENEIHRVKKMRVRDIWDNDFNKLDLIKRKGYEVLIIWESEYRKNPQQTLEKCIEFINE